MTEADRVLIKAAISQDAEVTEEMITKVGEERTSALISAAMSEAALRRFRGATVDQVREFADGLPTRFPDTAGEFEVAHAEAILRAAAFGEFELMESIAANEILSLCFLMTYAIMSHEDLDFEEREKYVDVVIAQAEETLG